MGIHDLAAQFAPGELEGQFRSDPSAEDGDGAVAALPSIPANSAVMRQLTTELRNAGARLPEDSPMRDLFARIERGEIGLRSALRDPSAPAPDAESLPPSTRALIEELQGEEER